jgi:glutamate 5-kinase
MYCHDLTSFGVVLLFGSVDGLSSKTFDYDLRACAAAGQNGLMSIYQSLFGQYDETISQVLISERDFDDEEIIGNVRTTMDTLLRNSIIPLINENDVTAVRKTRLRDDEGRVWWDNDSIAARACKEFGVDLMVMMTDTDGLYDVEGADSGGILKQEKAQNRDVISAYEPGIDWAVAEESRVSMLGMREIVDAATVVTRRQWAKVCVTSQNSIASRTPPHFSIVHCPYHT